MKTIPKISVTGTKGKTTVVAIVASALQQFEYDVLKVDTTGHYVNGEQRGTLTDSMDNWHLVPSVCPGRYLYEFLTDPQLSVSQKPVAVLECALGSSSYSGLGYRGHDVGIFLNVLEDHLGSSARLATRADIAKAKSFIVERVKAEGTAVFNADDELVSGAVKDFQAKRELNVIPCGLNFDYFDISAHLAGGGVAITQVDTNVVLHSQAGDTVLFDLKALPWTFNASFMPSVYNLLHATGAIYAFYRGELPANFREVMESIRLDQYGGRLTLLQAASGTKILADYAHEKISLGMVGDLARTISPAGKVIGVVRLAYDRTPELIAETGQAIASHYDQFVVYDKIDGHYGLAKSYAGKFQKVVGQVSSQLSEAIASKNPNVERILREDEAIARAAEIAGPEDCVVVIVNDDIKRSIGFIKDSFKAEFL